MRRVEVVAFAGTDPVVAANWITDFNIKPTAPNSRHASIWNRGDSVAAIIVGRSRKSIYLTEQFRYPTFAN